MVFVCKELSYYSGFTYMLDQERSIFDPVTTFAVSESFLTADSPYLIDYGELHCKKEALYILS